MSFESALNKTYKENAGKRKINEVTQLSEYVFNGTNKYGLSGTGSGLFKDTVQSRL